MTKKCKKTSVNVFLIRQIFKAGVASLVILFVSFFGAYSWYLFSLERWGCDFFSLKMAQVESGVAREMVLGQTEIAREIVQTLETQLVEKLGKVKLELIANPVGDVLPSYSCVATLTGGRISLPILFAGESLGVVNGRF